MEAVEDTVDPFQTSSAVFKQVSNLQISPLTWLNKEPNEKNLTLEYASSLISLTYDYPPEVTLALH